MTTVLCYITDFNYKWEHWSCNLYVCELSVSNLNFPKCYCVDRLLEQVLFAMK